MSCPWLRFGTNWWDPLSAEVRWGNFIVRTLNKDAQIELLTIHGTQFPSPWYGPTCRVRLKFEAVPVACCRPHRRFTPHPHTPQVPGQQLQTANAYKLRSPEVSPFKCIRQRGRGAARRQRRLKSRDRSRCGGGVSRAHDRAADQSARPAREQRWRLVCAPRPTSSSSTSPLEIP